MEILDNNRFYTNIPLLAYWWAVVLIYDGRSECCYWVLMESNFHKDDKAFFKEFISYCKFVHQ